MVLLETAAHQDCRDHRADQDSVEEKATEGCLVFLDRKVNLVAQLLLEDPETKEMPDFQDDQGVQGRMDNLDQLGLKEQLDFLGLVFLDLQVLKVMLDTMGNPADLGNLDCQGLMELLGCLV